MKTFTWTFTVFFLMLIGYQGYAQVPQSFNYQAVARNAAGDLLQNTNLGIRISIHEGSAGGTVVFQETHTPLTNQFGLFTLAVGQGTLVSGDFTTINWPSGIFWMQVEMDPAGGTTYTDMGTTQLLTVPFSMYAGSSGIKGDTNYIPKFSKNATLANSSLYSDKYGNVGLRITSPLTALHMDGTLRIDDNAPLIQFYDGTTFRGFIQSYGLNADLYITNYTATGQTLFTVNGLDVALRILPNQNIGINKDVPTAKLHIKGSSNDWTDGIRLEDDATTEFGDILCGQEGLLYYSQSAGNDHIFLTNAKNSTTYPPFTIKDNGTVGVGIAATVRDLHLRHAQYTASGGTGGFEIEQSSNGNRWTIYTSQSTSSLSLYYNNTAMGNFSNTTGAYSAVSDIRLKKDIKPMDPVLQRVLLLKPSQYLFKTQADNARMNLGLIAQEVYEIFPEVVNIQPDDTDGHGIPDLYTISYTELIPVLIKAIQEQQAQIEELKQQVLQLQNK